MSEKKIRVGLIGADGRRLPIDSGSSRPALALQRVTPQHA
jgi:hypothetical protein